MKMLINDELANAVVGTLIEVSSRSWGNPAERMIAVRDDDNPFVDTIVRCFCRNFEDAEILVDSTVIVYRNRVYPFNIRRDI